MATIGTLRIAPSGCLGLPFFSPDIPEPGHFLFFFPYFLWAHRSGNSSPLPPTRLLLSLTVHSRSLGSFGPCEPNFLSRGVIRCPATTHQSWHGDRDHCVYVA